MRDSPSSGAPPASTRTPVREVRGAVARFSNGEMGQRGCKQEAAFIDAAPEYFPGSVFLDTCLFMANCACSFSASCVRKLTFEMSGCSTVGTRWSWKLQCWFNITSESSHFLGVFQIKSVSFWSQTEDLLAFPPLRNVAG